MKSRTRTRRNVKTSASSSTWTGSTAGLFVERMDNRTQGSTLLRLRYSPLSRTEGSSGEAFEGCQCLRTRLTVRSGSWSPGGSDVSPTARGSPVACVLFSMFMWWPVSRMPQQLISSRYFLKK